MAEGNGTGSTPTEAGVSLGHDAWRRLRRNPAAMVALAIVAVVSLSAILAPWLAPFAPDAQRPWLQARPPGSSHPDVLQVNVFVPGRPAESTEVVIAGRTVHIHSTRQDVEEYRIIVRRRQVTRISRTRGAKQMPRLDLRGEDLVIERIGADGTVEAAPGPALFVRGQPPPEAWFPGGRSGVALLRVATPPRPVRYRITLDDGVVQTVTRGDTPLAEGITIAGDAVERIEVDGDAAVAWHLFGTDPSGRDLFSRVLYGGRISLLVGVVATAVSLVIGVAYGAVSAYLGGRADRLLMGTVDVLYGIPFMFLVILLLVNFGSNIIILFAALGAVQWLTMARIVRGQVLTLKNREFISAAILSGCSHSQVLLRHLVPNCLGPVIVYTTLTVPVVILEESFLAFIGLQVEFNNRALDSWGALVDAGARSMGQHPWLLIAPATVMAATLLALNVLGDGLRDALDPQLRGKL